MPFSTLISPKDLAARLGDPRRMIVDCRFSLANPGLGRELFKTSHIPGSLYAHLDEDLSGPAIRGVTGRHPLPPIARFAETLSAWGVDAATQIVAYDDAGGAYAARLWWLLRWLGHEAAALLDGGWQAWLAEGLPVTADPPTLTPRQFHPRPHPDMVVSTEEVNRMRADPLARVFDSRTADRYRGENETIDPVAGHIPGAVSAPYPDTLGPDGRFLPPAALRARFEALLGPVPPENAAFYCGSGVSAAVNLLALALAGLGDAKLYAGSWSEWITDPSLPVAIGDEGGSHAEIR